MHRAALSLLLALVLALAACGDDADVAVDDLDTEDAQDEPDVPEEPESEEADADDDSGDDGPGDDGPGDDAGEQEPGDGDASRDTPAPDPARVEEPCADHEDREMDAFLDVAAPVDGQAVAGDLELVGCANVPEGTVRYQLLADDGEQLVDDFTTAECGGPCVGEYRTSIDLGAADGHDTATLQVFWDSPADGEGEQDLTEIELTL